MKYEFLRHLIALLLAVLVASGSALSKEAELEDGSTHYVGAHDAHGCTARCTATTRHGAILTVSAFDDDGQFRNKTSFVLGGSEQTDDLVSGA
ncbi:MAG TPA: hypothetical protein VGC30_03185, partial [Dokdonella sp.]